MEEAGGKEQTHVSLKFRMIIVCITLWIFLTGCLICWAFSCGFIHTHTHNIHNSHPMKICPSIFLIYTQFYYISALGDKEPDDLTLKFYPLLPPLILTFCMILPFQAKFFFMKKNFSPCFVSHLFPAPNGIHVFCFFLIIFYWLCYYSCPDFSSFALFHPATPTHSGNPSHHCLCPWVMHISSLATPFLTLYFTSPCLFCIYLFAHLFCCCFVLFYFILFLPICTS